MAKKISIAFGADHAGFPVKKQLVSFMEKKGFRVVDFGTDSDQSTDYPDYAVKVAKAVAQGKVDRGILACGSGIGMAITANKVRGIRSAAVWSVKTAKLCAEHNWCNVLCVSGRFATMAQIKRMILAWLGTPYNKGGRHERRVKKIRKYESKMCRPS